MYRAEVPGTPRDAGDVEWFSGGLASVAVRESAKDAAYGISPFSSYLARSRKAIEESALKVMGTILFAQPDVYKLKLIQAQAAPTEDDKATHRAISRSHGAFNRHNTMGWTPDWSEE